jgi:HrpA-like RNA helicase
VHEEFVGATPSDKTIPLGEVVGYRVGQPRGAGAEHESADAKMVSASTLVEFVTEGILLQDMRRDPALSKFSAVLIDEAHERGKGTDILLYLLRRLLLGSGSGNVPKVLIMSASIDTQRFANYFGGCPIVDCPGTTHPVDICYQPLPGTCASLPNHSAHKLALSAFACAPSDPPEEICWSHSLIPHSVRVLFKEIVDKDERGDVLLFLPGQLEIQECVALIHLMAAATHGNERVIALPLYASLPQTDQQQALDPYSPAVVGRPPDRLSPRNPALDFEAALEDAWQTVRTKEVRSDVRTKKRSDGREHSQSSETRKVVCCTNVAETSLTVPGVRFVLDSGFARVCIAM